MHRLKVLWVAKGLGPGGMERLLVHHARNGNHDRIEYHAAYLVDRPNSVVPELEALGVRCTPLEPTGGADPRWIRDLIRVVRDHRIDVVHHHSPQPAAMSRLALRAMRNGPRLVYSEHNTWDCYDAATRAANAVTFLLDQAQFAVSESVRASVPRVLRHRLEPLTHGIDLAELRRAGSHRESMRADLGVLPDQVVVVNIAHLRSEKAQHVLLAAAAKLAGDFDNLVFLSVGHGPLEEELRSLHRELDLGNRFRFLGFREDAVSILAAPDVYCLSSQQEGLPVAFMEAAALGVVTRVGGLPEQIQHERSGLLVSPDDSLALAEALRRLIADRDLRRSLGDEAAANSAVFDARIAVRRQEAVYEQIVQGRNLP